ncbi:peroxiredoxin [Terrilactibacillus sp. S3-3]|nr:peroxiredoxin [Terrilactibacillus sp. S3-3]
MIMKADGLYYLAIPVILPLFATEFIAFEKLHNEFTKRNTELIGISIDQVQSHIKWIEWIQQNLGVQITFPIIADGLGNVAKRLGMIHPTRGSRTVRSVFIVDPEGTVRLVLTYPETIGRNVHEILRSLIALQTTDLYKAATPANWPNNEWLQNKLIIPPAKKTIQEANAQLAKSQAGELTCYDWWFCVNTMKPLTE